MTSSALSAGLRRLLAELPPADESHPIDVGVLGEYAAALRTVGPFAATLAYPSVAAHLEPGCNRCAADVMELQALARRAASGSQADAMPGRPPLVTTAAAAATSGSGTVGPEEAPDDDDGPQTVPDPLEIADAQALARTIEAERDALRAPLRPDPDAAIESRRRSNRQRHLLLVEAALVRQRLAARELFLARAQALAAGGPAHADEPAPADPAASRRRAPNPKAGLLLGHFAGQVHDVARLAARLGRLTVEVRRLGDDPRGPARSKSEALVVRGLALARDALVQDQRLTKLQGPLAGMVG